MMQIIYQPIGVIHSPFTELAGMPIQPAGAAGVTGTAVLHPEFTPGLQDLDGFSHIILLYHLHQVEAVSLTVTPFLDTQPRGVFATRAPKRPNPIGLSVVKLVSVKQNVLHLENVDVLDGTPLLDVKPYVPEFDHPPQIRTGWLAKAKGQVQNKKSDERFLDD
jgi:tRNA-Thr(GGU) m(6)t(6)A37 methyltransferase TsaA